MTVDEPCTDITGPFAGARVLRWKERHNRWCAVYRHGRLWVYGVASRRGRLPTTEGRTRSHSRCLIEGGYGRRREARVSYESLRAGKVWSQRNRPVRTKEIEIEAVQSLMPAT